MKWSMLAVLLAGAAFAQPKATVALVKERGYGQDRSTNLIRLVEGKLTNAGFRTVTPRGTVCITDTCLTVLAQDSDAKIAVGVRVVLVGTTLGIDLRAMEADGGDAVSKENFSLEKGKWNELDGRLELFAANTFKVWKERDAARTAAKAAEPAPVRPPEQVRPSAPLLELQPTVPPPEVAMPISPALVEQEKRSWVPVLVPAAVAVVGVGVAITGFALTEAKYGAIKNATGPIPTDTARRLAGEGTTWQTVAWVSTGVAVGAAATAVALALWPRDEVRVGFAPASGNGAAVSVSWSFR